MLFSTRRTTVLFWALLAGIATTALASYYIVLPYYRSQISWAQPSFKGIESALYDETHGRNLRILIVHGIGEHCTGYSDRLMRGVLEALGVDASPAIDEHLKRLRDRAQEQASDFVERYRNQGWSPEKPEADLAAHLDELANGIAAGDIPFAEKRKDNVAWDTGLERKREAKSARDLQLFVRYGLIDGGCGRVPLQQSVELDDFDPQSQKLARVNTCAAISRFADMKGNIDCHRLTLDFYDGKQLIALARKEIKLPKAPPRRCPENSPAPEDVRCAKAAAIDLGFLLTRTLRLPQDDGTLRLVRLYELTWDPATRWAKEQYISHDNEFDRDLVNQLLKNRVVNDSISDAVMYLGTSRPLIQFPLLTAFCKIVTDRLEPDGVDALAASLVDDEFRCGESNLAAENGKAFAEANELVILTHSLGTRVLLDTLGLLARRRFFLREFAEDLHMNHAYISLGEVSRIAGRIEPMLNALMGSLRKIFVLTNQIPLLEMASLGGPSASQLPLLDLRDIGRGFENFLEEREGVGAEPLQLVAFTDPNDLLSYSLRCWYQRHVLRGTPEIESQRKNLREVDPSLERTFLEAIGSCGPSNNELIAKAVGNVWRQVESDLNVRVAEVSVQLQSLRLPGIFADPSGVHSNYFDDDLINKLIACGAEEGASAPSSCAGYSAGESK